MCDVHVRRQQRRRSGVWFRLYVSPLLRRSSVRRLCLLTCRVERRDATVVERARRNGQAQGYAESHRKAFCENHIHFCVNLQRYATRSLEHRAMR